MTFRRSRSALGSLRLFYRVDIVAFCEGGHSLSYEDAIKPIEIEGTLDTLFWSNVAVLSKSGKKVHFKSVGSKEILRKIIDDINVSGCDSVSVCMDSDYDRYDGTKITHPRVALTMGYSWESDVLLKSVAYQVLCHLVGPSASQFEAELNSALVKLENHLQKWCEIDIALKSKSKPCILDRRKPLSVLDLDKFPPMLNEIRIAHKLSSLGYKRRPRSVVRIPSNEVLSVICGKLLSRIYYNLIMSLANRYLPKLRIEYENFMRIAIRETFSLLRTKDLPALEVHLMQQIDVFG